MVKTVGDSSWPFRLGDNATSGSGDYEIFLNPEEAYTQIEFPTIDGSDVIYDSDISVGESAGKIAWKARLNNCKIENTQAQWLLMMQILKHWSEESIKPYFTRDDKNSHGMEYMPNNDIPAGSSFDIGNFSRIKVRLPVITRHFLLKSNEKIEFNCELKRYTS